MRNSSHLLLILLSLIFFSHCSVQSTQKTIQGRITITQTLSSKVGPSDALYVFAYPLTPSPETTSAVLPETAPIAVKKIAPVLFPVQYQLSQQDTLFPEQHFEGDLIMRVKIKRELGSGLERKTELIGEYKKNPVRAGAEQVDMVIDQEK